MDYNSADLTSVLRTLSALSNQQHHHQPLQQPSPPAPAPLQKTTTTQSHKLEQGAPAAPAAPSPAEEDDPYEPSESLPHIPVAPTPALAPTAPSTPSQTRSHPNAATEDTSTITTWPTALRYVMRTVAQNESIQQRIRWLMQRQYDHEKQWWQGREALLRKQASRIEKKKELDAVLRFVGAPVDENKQISTAEEDRAELTNYDAKVYKASKQMSEAMGAELRALRIPFFNIKKNLVSESTTWSPGAARQPSGNHHDPGKQLIFLSREELSTLQLRMLELLQDLCRE
ncbi:hypothetical protein ASPCADRAFT_209048 [Aspergillus carbonarius ITEM 5010]|uniref:Uncharacterized protein n=1 Tax=Aspergillus carbonarius (strain ITEM 5010) TaxID=602072 RepID=A0A1R3RGT9_ASPC5|nr:hypothetical protein ASPCADRAFT_7172 [Aspergillus carbonarius ITEM 5010]OOF93775.1 hypothetical protein ASPCADRAFT_209048 [Aspergillus carbonarius ITEM 5010]